MRPIERQIALLEQASGDWHCIARALVRGKTFADGAFWRREGDSNPRRAVNPYTLSRRAT